VNVPFVEAFMQPAAKYNLFIIEDISQGTQNQMFDTVNVC